MWAGQLERLLRHMEWADALVWSSCSGPRPARDMGEIRERLLHIHTVQRAFLQIWRGEEIDVPDASTFEQLDTLLAWARPYYAEAFELVGELTEQRLAEPVALPWDERRKERWGGAGPVSLADTILQVVTHSGHHRGQVLTCLRALGCATPLVDYIVWVSAGRPAARWTPSPAGG